MANPNPRSGYGQITVCGDRNDFNGVRVFSATMAPDRARLGERITDWLAENPGMEVADTIVTQSSDESFHCLAITVFYREPL